MSVNNDNEGQTLIIALQKRFAGLWARLAGDPEAEERDFFLEEYLRDLEERAYLETTIANQYRGRYLVELVQNGVDAMHRLAEQNLEAASKWRCFIGLSEQALWVANDGQAFGPDDVRGLTAMGRSTKTGGRYIGHKGLGFRAVLEISDTPEVYSAPYSFGFSRADTLALLQNSAAGVTLGDVPTLSVPFFRDPASLPESEQVWLTKLTEQGYATVVRLPLKRPDLRYEVAASCRAFARGDNLLFLPYIRELRVEISGEDAIVVSKSTADIEVRADQQDSLRLKTVTLSRQDDEDRVQEWLLVEPVQPLSVPRELVENLNDRTWQSVRTAAIALALPVMPLNNGGLMFKRRLDPLPFFAHFPTEEANGLGLAVHADFYLSASRKEIDEDTSYNRWLLRSLVEFLVGTALPALQSRYPDEAALLDLLADVAYHNGPFGRSFRTVLDERMVATAFVPVGGGRYRRPSEVVWTPLIQAGVLLFLKIFPQPPAGFSYPVPQLEEIYITEDEGFEYRRLRRFLQELGVKPIQPAQLPELWPQAQAVRLDRVVTRSDVCTLLALWYEQLAKGTFSPQERQRTLLQAVRDLPVLPIGDGWQRPFQEDVFDLPATSEGRERLQAQQEFFGPVKLIAADAYDIDNAEFEPQLRAWFKALGVKSLDPESRNPFEDDENGDNYERDLYRY